MFGQISIHRIIARNKFLTNLGWLGASEIVVRLTRLLTAIVLARMLDPLAFGLAALVLTVNELIRVFSRNGIGAMIVQCHTEELDEVCNTAYRLNWLFCSLLFVLQSLIAYPVADFYDAPSLVPMLQLLALSYLFMPFAMVHAALVQRQQRLKSVAMIDGGQVAVDNLITAVFALSGMGAWAIVLPKFLTMPIWLIGYRCALSWQPSGPLVVLRLWRQVLAFGRYYLSIEVLKTARLNVDNLLIGRFLGMEALGIYYFARNAGLGFSLTLIKAVNSALYPNLCEVRTRVSGLRARFARNLTQIACLVVPLLLLQAGLAFWYVPLVFGTQWTHAVPVIAILCLSAIPRAFGESASALMLAAGRINHDFVWNTLLTLLFVLVVAFAAMVDLMAVAIGILVLYLVTNPAYLVYSWRRCCVSERARVTTEISDCEQEANYGR